MNKSKDLIELFRSSIRNKKSKSYSYTPPPMSSIHRIPGTGYPTIGKSINIFFYEWSDVTRRPRQFDNITEFDTVLKTYGLYLQLYQRDMIADLGEAYVSCFRGRKELCVRGSYQNLLEAMNRHDRLKTEMEMREQGVPYNKGNGNIPVIKSGVVRRPPMYAFESQTEMEEMNGNWFG